LIGIVPPPTRDFDRHLERPTA